MLSEKYRIIFVKSWWIVIIKLHRDFHFIYVVFVSITNMVSSHGEDSRYPLLVKEGITGGYKFNIFMSEHIKKYIHFTHGFTMLFWKKYLNMEDMSLST